MDKKYRILAWIPRVLAILFILFISVFALDAFSGKVSLLQSLIAFLVHLIPSFVLLAALIIAWKRPLTGGWVFVLVSIALSILWGAYREMIRFMMLTLPMVATGVLFIISGLLVKQRPVKY